MAVALVLDVILRSMSSGSAHGSLPEEPQNTGIVWQ